MRTLVTGGAGFIGSHIVDRLLADGHEVLVLDNFITGRPENLAHHKGNAQLKLVNEDFCDYLKIEPYFKDIDYVFHLGAVADIVPSIQEPDKYYRSNVQGTFNVLEASRKYSVKKFLYAASSSCYGIADRYPTRETDPISPQYPYALTKNLGEQMVLHWGQVYKLPVISLRLFNVYGTRSRTSGTYGAVFGVFLAQKLAGKDLTIVGDGSQTRDFTYVTDVADAFVTAANSEVSQEIFNVGSDNTYSVNYLASLLGAGVTYIPKRPGEPECTHADIEKIKNQLNWRPKVSFEEGVKLVLDNIDYWRDAPVWTVEGISKATEDWFKYLK